MFHFHDFAKLSTVSLFYLQSIYPNNTIIVTIETDLLLNNEWTVI